MFDSSIKPVDVALSDSSSLHPIFLFFEFKKDLVTILFGPWIFLVPPIHFEMYLHLVLHTSFFDYALVIRYFLV